MGYPDKIELRCNSVLPLVFDNSLSYYEVVAKCIAYINSIIDDIKNLNDKIDSLDIEHVTEIVNEMEEIIENIPVDELETLVSDVDTLKTSLNTLTNTVNELSSKTSALEDWKDDIAENVETQKVTLENGNSITDSNDGAIISMANGLTEFNFNTNGTIQKRSRNSQSNPWGEWAKISGISMFNRTNCNAVFFGDSWTVGTGIPTADRPTKRFTAIISRKLNCSEYNYGVGASGFTITGSLIKTQITTASSQMTAAQKSLTGVVVIVGGVNDYRHNLASVTSAQFSDAIIECCNLAHNAFPNAIIVVGIGNTNLSYFPSGAKAWYKNAIIECEKQLTFPCLILHNLYNSINGDVSLYNPDKLHPNEGGHSAFAGYIANAILGGGQSVSKYMGDVTLADNVTINYPLTIYRVDDEIIIDQRSLIFSEGITENTVIGTVPPYLAPPSNAYYTIYRGNLPVGTIVITANGSVRVIPNSGTTLPNCFNQQIRYIWGRETNTDET